MRDFKSFSAGRCGMRNLVRAAGAAIGVTFVALLLFTQAGFAQRVKRLGDLPKSDVSVNVYQIYGFQENKEGYKIVYVGNNNEPSYLYIPAELLEKVKVFKPQQNTYSQNFLIIWKSNNKVTRVEWYMPQAIDYKLPNYSIEPFSEKDKEIFKAIVRGGELILGTDVGGTAEIRAPGGEE
jgi:hypothetical protein